MGIVVAERRQECLKALWHLASRLGAIDLSDLFYSAHGVRGDSVVKYQAVTTQKPARYYRCVGAILPEMRMVIIVLRLLPNLAVVEYHNEMTK